MPPIETADCRQTALLWARTGVNSFGQYTVDRDNPTELAPPSSGVRWEWKRAEIIDPAGNPLILEAFVIAKQEITVGSCMWLGTLEDWLGTGSAGNDSEVMKVVTSEIYPDIKNRNTRYEVGLQRYGDAPPVA